MHVGTRTAHLVWIGYWITLFILTHIPVGPRIPGVPHGDKLLHLMAFFALAFLGGWAQRRRATPKFLLLWAGAYAAYAVFDEFLQPMTGRTMCWSDLLADWLGIGMATAILIVLPKRGTELAQQSDDTARDSM